MDALESVLGARRTMGKACEARVKPHQNPCETVNHVKSWQNQ